MPAGISKAPGSDRLGLADDPRQPEDPLLAAVGVEADGVPATREADDPPRLQVSGERRVVAGPPVVEGDGPVQYTHGMIGCSEWTGVPLSVLLEEAGYDRKRARCVLAEGADGASLTRTIPLAMALTDVLVVYGQNGEMLRPEQGYPLRLVVPGVQGVSSVKWLRRLEVGDAPWNTREESLHYIDLMPGGIHRQYTWIQEAKSVITSPSGGQVLLDRGYHEIRGLAWSGRGTVKRVDVSTDGGRNWRTAKLQAPILAKALTRFRLDWTWDGGPALLQSRVIDETGYVQPSIRQLREVRGTRSIYHNNAIQTWRVDPAGDVRMCDGNARRACCA